MERAATKLYIAVIRGVVTMTYTECATVPSQASADREEPVGCSVNKPAMPRKMIL